MNTKKEFDYSHEKLGERPQKRAIDKKHISNAKLDRCGQPHMQVFKLGWTRIVNKSKRKKNRWLTHN